ncbi:MAG: hypothetical protein OEY94_06860 [Alphaproteobacteria bacterium]|nr:hypothetical protein [Alphaproteobacteria bacterium]
MSKRDVYRGFIFRESDYSVPFESTEEAWFWFIMAQQAKCDGARFMSGAGNVPRPCEPVDILNILNRLYRKRRLLRDHLLVMRHYGRRNMPPDSRRVKEAHAARLWDEAMDRLETPFVQKGIVRETNWMKRNTMHSQSSLFDYEGQVAE